MNLAKLFNFKYLMQNIKKSKMAIILFLSIVPIFTSLIIITSASNSYVPSFLELGLANIIFMYITPFILSFSLFGYVYKKKSIDFIGSMPISRKSIFVTNTIGGIVLIVLTQLITLICTLLLGAITESIIFTQLAFDIFIFQTIAYILVFTVANLAMSISGNVVTQIVTTLLILFTISSSILYVNLWDSPRISLMDEDYKISSNYNITNEINYTAPSLAFNGEYYYNSESMVKMTVLSIVYIVLGYFAFKNKKMEAAGESFENKNVHMVVKGLTLIPFAMILVALVDSDEWEAIMFLIAIVTVYYFVYDLITNKKGKVKDNIIFMITSLVILFGFYSILINVTEDREYKIELTDIKSFEFESTNGYDYAVGQNNKIEDISLIEKMLYANNYSNAQYSERETVRLVLNLKNGQRKSIRIYSVPTEILKSVMKNIETIELSKNAKVKLNSDVNLTSEEQENLRLAVETALSNTRLDELYDLNKNSGYYNRLNVYDYKNHEVVEFSCSIEISEEVFDIVTKASNRAVAKKIQKLANMGEVIYLNINNYEVLKKYMSEYNDYGYYGEMPQELIDFILINAETKCNSSEEYIVLSVDGNRFWSNDINTIAGILKEYYKTDMNYNYDKYYYEDYSSENAETTIITVPDSANVNTETNVEYIELNDENSSSVYIRSN